MSNIENIVQSILSTNKEARSQGENLFYTVLTQSPDLAIQGLMLSLQSTSPDISELSAVLLRKALSHPSAVQLTPNTKSHLRSGLLSQISQHPFSLLRKIGDILCPFALQEQFFEDLMGQICQWSESDRDPVKKLSMYMFELMSENSKLFPFIQAHSASILEIIWKLMHDQSVRCYAVSILYKVLIRLDNPSGVYQILERSLQILLQYDAELNDALISMGDLTDVLPEVWNSLFHPLVQVLGAIIKNSQASSSTRNLAADVIITFVKTSSIDLTEEFIAEVLALAFLMMTEVPHAFSPEVWNSEDDNMWTSDSTFETGQNMLDAISERTDSGASFAIQLIHSHLAANHWARQHTGILSIGLISYEYFDYLKPILPDIFLSLRTFGSSENPRIRWAVLRALKSLCKTFRSHIPEIYHSVVLEILVNCLQKTNFSKVSILASEVFISYTKTFKLRSDLVDPCLVPYIKDILGAFYELLGDNKLLQGIIRSLGKLSKMIDMADYVSTFAPGLMSIVIGDPVNRAAAIKCLASMPLSQEQAISFASELLKIKETVDCYDEVYSAILESVPQLALRLGAQYENFLDMFIPVILEQALTFVEVNFSDSDTAVALQASPNDFVLNFMLCGIGEKQLRVNCNALILKQLATKVIYKLMKSLEIRYNKYIFKTIEVLEKCITQEISSKIREVSIKASGIAVLCCESQQSILVKMIPFWLSILSSCTRADFIGVMRAINRTLGVLDCVACISLAQAYSLVIMISEKTSIIAGQVHGPDDLGASEILSEFFIALDILLKSFKRNFLDIFYEKLAPGLGEILYSNSEMPDSTVEYAIDVFCSLAKYTQDVNSHFISKLIELCYSNSQRIRGKAAVAIGVCVSVYDTNDFLTVKDTVIGALTQILSHPEARGKYLQASKNAVQTIGAISMKFDDKLLSLCQGWCLSLHN